MATSSPARPRFEGLPYGPHMTRALEPLHRAFGVLNRRVVVPAFRAGLGPIFSTPISGSMMVLRTTGRSSGRRREAPLGYAVLDGAVYCCAGFGRQTAWYRNLQADPHVEVVLPTVAFAGLAETVSDRDEWGRAFPVYLEALGVIGRLTVGDVRQATPERLEALRRDLPLVRIRPTGIAPGPADPGGWGWIVVQATMVAGSIWVVRRLRRGNRRGASS